MNDFMTEQTLNMRLELQENIKHIRLAFKKIKPSELTVSINENDIVIMITNSGLGMAPYIRKVKFKRFTDYTTRLRKRKPMTLALLTGITNCINMFIKHDWKLMTMKYMANDGSGRMTKVCMPM